MEGEPKAYVAVYAYPSVQLAKDAYGEAIERCEAGEFMRVSLGLAKDADSDRGLVTFLAERRSTLEKARVTGLFDGGRNVTHEMPLEYVQGLLARRRNVLSSGRGGELTEFDPPGVLGVDGEVRPQ